MTARPDRQSRVRPDLVQIRVRAERISSLARALAREYEEAHDAYLRSLRGGLRSLPRKGSKSDPTGETALAGDYHRLQSVLGFVARRVEAARKKMGGALAELEHALGDAESGLHGAWLDTDPDLRDDRRAKRAAALEALQDTGTE